MYVIVTNKVALWAANYSACVVYTKTIIHLSVGESGRYLPRRGCSVNIHHYSPPLQWIIVNYPSFKVHQIFFFLKKTTTDKPVEQQVVLVSVWVTTLIHSYLILQTRQPKKLPKTWKLTVWSQTASTSLSPV